MPVTAGGRGAVRTSAVPTGQCDGGGRHYAVDRSAFTARLDAGGGYPGHAPSVRDHGPTVAGRGGAAIPQPVQGTDCLESPPSIDSAGSGSPSWLRRIPPHRPRVVNSRMTAHSGSKRNPDEHTILVMRI